MVHVKLPGKPTGSSFRILLRCRHAFCFQKILEQGAVSNLNRLLLIGEQR
jgi:hypothetical protein